MKHIQDLGEFLESQAGDDPVMVECWVCDGKGRKYSLKHRKTIPCHKCEGLGVCRNPDLEP